MASRPILQNVLEDILGTENVYFQPPESIKLQYPCIRYNLDDIYKQSADNCAYIKTKRYSVTVIDKDPYSEIKDRLLELPMCSMERFFCLNNLNHWVFTLFY